MLIAIFCASSIPDLTELPGGVSDHVGHFIGYALLGGLMLRAMAHARWAEVRLPRAWWAFAASAAYGASDEGHQFLVHGRTPALDDWQADVLGAATAVVVVYLTARAIARLRLRRGAAGRAV
jgi:VanZ family protein